MHVSPSKKAVIKAERTLKIGEVVMNKENERVGKVFDVLGPTVSPYIEVEVDVEDPQSLVNCVLYSPSSRKHSKRSKKEK